MYDWQSFLSLLIPDAKIVSGAVIAVSITILVEFLRKPRLRIEIPKKERMQYYNYVRPDENKEIVKFERARFIYLALVNKPLPWLFRWMMRESAIGCHGVITFHHYYSKDRLGIPAMPIRWVDSPEPIVHSAADQAEKGLILDADRLTIRPRIDLQAGESEKMDIVARIEDDRDLYGWNNESYSAPSWRNERYKLPLESDNRYLVAITVLCSGAEIRDVFVLDNSGLTSELRLRNTDKTQKKAVLSKLYEENFIHATS